MTQEHPITPPPELVIEWWNQCTVTSDNLIRQFATQAARWGADQELEACIAWMMQMGYWGEDGKAVPALRAARRPKPPSLKGQALQALYRFDDTEGHKGLTPEQIAEDFVLIRRALESLPD